MSDLPAYRARQYADDWFAEHGHLGWASCPLTENGMLRILSRRSSADAFVPLPDLVDLLKRFRENSVHQFWADDISGGVSLTAVTGARSENLVVLAPGE